MERDGQNIRSSVQTQLLRYIIHG